MKGVEISLNPLAEFVFASDRRKDSIIRQQKRPVEFIIARYATARARMKRFFKEGFSKEEIVKGIEVLQGRMPHTDFQKNDRRNSIEALRTFLMLQFPNDFQNLKCSFTTERNKHMLVNRVRVRVAPDLILRGTKDGQPFIGGIKFHISKSQQFDREEALLAAAALKLFLINEIATEEEIVNPKYCLSIDVFGERITPAPDNHIRIAKQIEKACDEIKTRW